MSSEAIPQTEAAFLQALIAAARAHGFLVHHCRPARRGDGRWATPIQGDPGFPDLILAHPRTGAVLAIECKAGRRARVSPAQRRWLAAFQGEGVYAAVWTPDDWPQILELFQIARAEAIGRR